MLYFDFRTRSDSNIATWTSKTINSQIDTATRAPFETILITNLIGIFAKFEIAAFIFTSKCQFYPTTKY